MSEPSDRDILPYATDASTRAGHTPVGIVMFAASHLLFGAALLLVAWVLERKMPPGVPMLERSVPLLIALGALPMLSGGTALLLKGPTVWAIALISFSLVVAVECLVAAHASAMTVRYMREGNPDVQWAVVYLLFAFIIALLGHVVLRYLTREKARKTFFLPPGEVGPMTRAIPRILLFVLAVAIMAGPLFSGVRELFPD
jgi:uncharacterized membrane protein